ncbi:MAG: adenosine deaminase [Candidatus Binataceae bacterium]
MTTSPDPMTNTFIRAIPKAELHMHLEGALEPELMFALARRNGVRLPAGSVEELRASYNFSNLQSFLDLYYAGTATLVTQRDFAELTASYLRHAAADNVLHAELFFDPQSHTARGIPFATVINGIHEALEAGRRDYGISSHLIMCFLRHLSEDEALATFDQALPFRELLTGVGLDSSEAGHPPSKFASVFARARAEGLHIVAHAGEEGPANYIRQALDLLRAERIDHGVRAIEDPALLDRLACDRIPLTVCPLSNIKLRVFPAMADHVLKRLLAAGLCVTINSDDPAYFGGYVADNYIAAHDALGLSRGELHRLAANSFEASFLPEDTKRTLLAGLDHYFAAS